MREPTVRDTEVRLSPGFVVYLHRSTVKVTHRRWLEPSTVQSKHVSLNVPSVMPGGV